MPKGALGKPVDGVDLAVISPETGEECPPAEFDAEGRLLNAGEAIGEIVNRSGRGSFEGYYQREDAEQERLRRGWYWTGDLGYVDADGFFYFAGRTGDWLRVDSENFAAGPVEAILSRHPDLAVAAVYPVPDTASGAGDQVMVALETVPGNAFDPDAFAAWLAAQPDLGPEVAAALRPGLALAPPDGHREGDQGRPAGRGLGLRRRRSGGDRSGAPTSGSPCSPTTTGPRWPPGWPRTAGLRWARHDVALPGSHASATISRTPVRSPTRWSPGSSGGGALPAPFLLAPDVDRRHAEPAWSPDVGLPRVADEDDVGRVDAERLDRRGVDAGVRLARPGPGRGDPGVDQMAAARPRSRKPSSSQPQFEQTPMASPAARRADKRRRRLRDRPPSAPGPTPAGHR